MRITLLVLSISFTMISLAWNIGGKGRVNGQAIHTSYFLTPNNAEVPVIGKAFMGQEQDGICQVNTYYELGVEKIKSGDVIDIDAYLLKSLVGGNYTCMQINYFYRQMSVETIFLDYDGINYMNSYPTTSVITIL